MTCSINIVVPALSLADIRVFLLRHKSDAFTNKFVFVLPKSLTLNIDRGLRNQNIIQQAGHGIYNAINEGVQSLQADWYVVAGTDDTISELLFEHIHTFVEKNTIYTPTVVINNRQIQAKRSYIFHLHKALVSEHAVGAIIPKSLHLEIGYYNESYLIAADADFLIKCRLKSIKFNKLSFCSGIYSSNGISTSRYIRGQYELISVLADNLVLSHVLSIQLVLIRIFRYGIANIWSKWICWLKLV